MSKEQVLSFDAGWDAGWDAAYDRINEEETLDPKVRRARHCAEYLESFGVDDEMLERALKMIRSEAEPSYTEPVERCAQIVSIVDSALGDSGEVYEGING